MAGRHPQHGAVRVLPNCVCGWGFFCGIATDYFAAHWFCRSGIKGLPRKSQTMGEGVPAAATTAPPLKHLHLQEKS